MDRQSTGKKGYPVKLTYPRCWCCCQAQLQCSIYTFLCDYRPPLFLHLWFKLITKRYLHILMALRPRAQIHYLLKEKLYCLSIISFFFLFPYKLCIPLRLFCQLTHRLQQWCMHFDTSWTLEVLHKPCLNAITPNLIPKLINQPHNSKPLFQTHKPHHQLKPPGHLNRTCVLAAGEEFSVLVCCMQVWLKFLGGRLMLGGWKFIFAGCSHVYVHSCRGRAKMSEHLQGVRST